MFTKLLTIPFSRLSIYLIILGFLPSIGGGLIFFSKKAAWTATREHLSTVQCKAESKYLKQLHNLNTRAHYQNSDHLYIDHQLETMRFLKREKEALENLLQNRAYTGNEAAEKRYAFLTSKENRLVFSESNLQKGDDIQEATEVMAHPIEIDNQDLKEILARIEGEFPHKPQLIITDLKLTRKENLSKNEVFDLNLKLIKREFNKS